MTIIFRDDPQTTRTISNVTLGFAFGPLLRVCHYFTIIMRSWGGGELCAL